MPSTARKSPRERANPTSRKAAGKSTTVRIPRLLSKEILDHRDNGSQSVNDFVVKSVKEKLQALKRRQIDEQFAGMGTDDKYQRETLRIAQEFESSDWNALRKSEEK